MRFETIQTFIVEYDVPDTEAKRFMDALEEQDGMILESYEVNQEFIGEQLIPRSS